MTERVNRLAPVLALTDACAVVGTPLNHTVTRL